MYMICLFFYSQIAQMNQWRKKVSKDFVNWDANSLINEKNILLSVYSNKFNVCVPSSVSKSYFLSYMVLLHSTVVKAEQ